MSSITYKTFREYLSMKESFNTSLPILRQQQPRGGHPRYYYVSYDNQNYRIFFYDQDRNLEQVEFGFQYLSQKGWTTEGILGNLGTKGLLGLIGTILRIIKANEYETMLIRQQDKNLEDREGKFKSYNYNQNKLQRELGYEVALNASKHAIIIHRTTTNKEKMRKVLNDYLSLKADRLRN